MANPFILIAKSEVTSATASVDLTFDSSYDNYYLSFSNVVGDTNDSRLQGQVKVGGVLQTSTYSRASSYYNLGGGNFSTSGENGNGTGTFLFRTDDAGFTTLTGCSVNGEIYIHHSQDNDRFTLVNGHSEGMNTSAAEMRFFTIAGCYHSDDVISDLTLSMDSGNIASGKFKLYAINNS
jgi:hypothetical protein